LTGLASGRRTSVEVYVPSPIDPYQPVGAFTTVTAATSPAPGGVPRIVITHSAQLLGYNDFAQVVVDLANRGDGDARQVEITDVSLAPGWQILSEGVTGQLLPDTLDLGNIGAGGAGAFLAWIVRGSGYAAPDVTVSGTYIDAAGTLRKF
jgi:hypothetical protein